MQQSAICALCGGPIWRRAIRTSELERAQWKHSDPEFESDDPHDPEADDETVSEPF